MSTPLDGYKHVAARSLLDLRVLFSLGFGALGVGTIAAYNNPATSYEPSIYSGTPLIFWIGCVLALVISVGVAFTTNAGRIRKLGIILGGLSMTNVVALPIVRGYYYVGEGDSLSHLGATRDLIWGNISTFDLRYPAVHALGAISSIITDIDVTHILLLFVVVFVVSFFIFVPLVLRELSTDERVVIVGVFSGFLLLQLNFLGAHMHIHPTSQAVMFAATVFYLFVGYYRRGDMRFFAMLVLVSGMFVLLHPQQAANFVIFFGTVAMIQVVHTIGQRYVGLNPGPHIVPVALVFGFLFWLWASRLSRFESSLSGFLVSLLTDTETATQVASRGLSVGELGGSLEEVFLKMFLVALIYCFLAGSFMIAVSTDLIRLPVANRFRFIVRDVTPEGRVLLLYFIGGVIAVSGLFVGYLVGDLSSQYFRHYAFIMVVVTFMGAITLGRMLTTLEGRLGPVPSRTLSTVVVLSFLLLSLLVVFPSPYIYQTSGHVPESQMDGYEYAFEYGHEEISYDHVRSSVSRYGTAINGIAEQDRRDYYRDGVRRGGVPDNFNDQQMAEYFGEPVYLAVSAADRVRDPVIYQGFRFSHNDFAYLETDVRINKVQSSEGVDLYLIRPD